MKRIFKFSILILFLMTMTLPILYLYYREYIARSEQSSVPHEFYKFHIVGGFSVDTPELAGKAAADGIQVAFQYGKPPSESETLGQKLESLQIKVIDGYISNYLHYYECHRTKLLMPSLIGPGQYCQDDPYPNLVDANALLTMIATHLKQVKDNRLIIGYWVLDDWVSWDPGSARQILMKIHDLIGQYTPGRLAICGFGGNIGLHKQYYWDDWVADNFSPRACDEVGFYIYAPSLASTTPTSSPDTYDWPMSGILPAMFASLQHRGWNMKREPLIGIGQAFGGPITNTDRYWVTPTAKDIETQSRSFCEHGATGLTFYAWNDDGYGPTTQTPMNSPEIEKGIRNGIAACKQYWSRHP